MRDFRIRKRNEARLINKLLKRGYRAEVSKCPPKTTWGNGCPDPQCCPQHPEAIIHEHYARMPNTWTAIKTNAPSNLIHRLLYEVDDGEEIKDR
jgi:hypothetical protein